jgi:hypothetical protein
MQHKLHAEVCQMLSHFGSFTGVTSPVLGANGRLIGQESKSKLTRAEKKSRRSISMTYS